MKWISELFVKLAEVFTKQRKTAIERIEKTRARLLNRFYKKSKKKELKEAEDDLDNKEFQELLINQANDKLEQQSTD